jgi:hypothetical protein
MSIWNLLTNTIEGAAQVTINTAKLVVGAALSPIDDGETIEDAAKGVRDGVEKIDDSEPKP